MNLPVCPKFSTKFSFTNSRTKAIVGALHCFEKMGVDKKKRKEILLPEAMIHHIQSFMSGKEAAQSTLISKSWYNAWLIRPSLDIDDGDFRHGFEEFATKTMQRYKESGFKIDSFRLRSRCEDIKIVRSLIVDAMKIGATDLELELPHSLALPQEVLESETLVRLSLIGCKLDRRYAIRCSTLKSLSLYNVQFSNKDVVKDIIMCCSTSIEELSLSNVGYTEPCLSLKGMNMFELHKLRRLFLRFLDFDTMFFADFASRFPCVKDLSIVFCSGFKRIQIDSMSLETICLMIERDAWKCEAQFDVPNIHKFFCFTGSGLPTALSINGGSREWELDMTITCYCFHDALWFLSLKSLLEEFRLSKISLSVELNCVKCVFDIKVVPEPVVLENLMIRGRPSECCEFMVRLFGICRPKFITDYWSDRNDFLIFLFKKLMHQVIIPECWIPHPYKVLLLDLKKVNVEIYEMLDTKWEPLVLEEPLDISETPVNKRKVRFQLIWTD